MAESVVINASPVDTRDVEELLFFQCQFTKRENISWLASLKSSIILVFSLWSTMVAATLLVMPRIARDVGIIPAILASLAVFCTNTYAAIVIEHLNRRIAYDTSSILQHFGRTAFYVGIVSSVLIIIGATMLCHVYMCDTIMYFAGLSVNDMTWRPIIAICIAAAIWTISLLRKIDPLLKAASLSVILTGFLVVFIVAKAWHQLETDDDCSKNVDDPQGVGFTSFGALVDFGSSMALSLFTHPILGSITRTALVRSNNYRDIVFAFGFAACSVSLPACFAVYAFRYCADFDDDYLVMFSDQFANAARVAIVILVGTVYPILLFNGRNQLLSVIAGDEYSYPTHLITNTGLLVCTTFPCAVNMATTVVASASGVVALFWALILPFTLYTILRCKSADPADRMTWSSYVLHISIMLFGLILMMGTILNIIGVY